MFTTDLVVLVNPSLDMLIKNMSHDNNGLFHNNLAQSYSGCLGHSFKSDKFSGPTKGPNKRDFTVSIQLSINLLDLHRFFSFCLRCYIFAETNNCQKYQTFQQTIRTQNKIWSCLNLKKFPAKKFINTTTQTVFEFPRVKVSSSRDSTGE